MSSAARIPAGMTVEEFQDWRAPAELRDRRWQLVDGEPRCMSPAGINHGLPQSEAAILIGLDLRTTRPPCRVIVAPGVIPHVRADFNERVPDIGVTCAPTQGGTFLNDPVLLIETISPSNEADRRADAWAYTSIPSVREVLLLVGSSLAAELLRRGADGNWPESPALLGADDTLRLTSIGFAASLRALYAATSLEA